MKRFSNLKNVVLLTLTLLLAVAITAYAQDEGLTKLTAKTDRIILDLDPSDWSQDTISLVTIALDDHENRWEADGVDKLIDKIPTISPEVFAVIVHNNQWHFKHTASGKTRLSILFGKVEGTWTRNAARIVAICAPDRQIQIQAIYNFDGQWKSQGDDYAILQHVDDFEIQLVTLKKSRLIHPYVFEKMMANTVSYSIAERLVRKASYSNIHWSTISYLQAIRNHPTLTVAAKEDLQINVVNIQCTTGKTKLDPIQAAIWRQTAVTDEVVGKVNYYAKRHTKQSPLLLSNADPFYLRLKRDNYFVVDVLPFKNPGGLPSSGIKILGRLEDYWVNDGRRYDNMAMVVLPVPKTEQDPNYVGTFRLVMAGQKTRDLEKPLEFLQGLVTDHLQPQTDKVLAVEKIRYQIRANNANSIYYWEKNLEIQGDVQGLSVVVPALNNAQHLRVIIAVDISHDADIRDKWCQEATKRVAEKFLPRKMDEADYSLSFTNELRLNLSTTATKLATQVARQHVEQWSGSAEYPKGIWIYTYFTYTYCIPGTHQHD